MPYPQAVSGLFCWLCARRGSVNTFLSRLARKLRGQVGRGWRAANGGMLGGDALDPVRLGRQFDEAVNR